jgi:hypothetical protein
MTVNEQEIISLLRATIISSRKPLNIQKLKRDFYGLNGFAVPYRKLGAQNIGAFLLRHGNVFKIAKRHGFIVTVDGRGGSDDVFELDRFFGV